MKDRLEQFINENRADFDNEIPNLKVWADIDKQINTDGGGAKRRTLWRYAWIAASILFLLTSGAFIGQRILAPSEAELADTELVSPEFEEMEAYYQSQIKQKKAQLARYSEDTSVEQDLLQIDTFMEELKQELKNAVKGNEEQIINAMINNYQTKIAILERVLDRIQTTNQETPKSGEDASIDI